MPVRIKVQADQLIRNLDKVAKNLPKEQQKIAKDAAKEGKKITAQVIHKYVEAYTERELGKYITIEEESQGGKGKFFRYYVTVEETKRPRLKDFSPRSAAGGVSYKLGRKYVPKGFQFPGRRGPGRDVYKRYYKGAPPLKLRGVSPWGVLWKSKPRGARILQIQKKIATVTRKITRERIKWLKLRK